MTSLNILDELSICSINVNANKLLVRLYSDSLVRKSNAFHDKHLNQLNWWYYLHESVSFLPAWDGTVLLND